MCQHQPACPPAEASGREAAHVVTAHPEQGWSLLCNGVILFDDSGELLPDGRAVAPPLAAAPRRAALEVDLRCVPSRLRRGSPANTRCPTRICAHPSPAPGCRNRSERLVRPSRKAIKIATPSIVEWIVDRAIQVHGAAGLSQDFPLAEAFALSRTLRFAGGPGEVRKIAVADAELSRQRQRRRTRDVRRADRPSWIPDQTGHRDPSLASAEAPTGWA